MLEAITWGTPASLLCLGVFFAGIGVFIKPFVTKNEN